MGAELTLGWSIDSAVIFNSLGKTDLPTLSMGIKFLPLISIPPFFLYIAHALVLIPTSLKGNPV